MKIFHAGDFDLRLKHCFPGSIAQLCSIVDLTPEAWQSVAHEVSVRRGPRRSWELWGPFVARNSNLLLPHLRQVEIALEANPHLGARSERLGQADGHFRRYS